MHDNYFFNVIIHYNEKKKEKIYQVHVAAITRAQAVDLLLDVTLGRVQDYVGTTLLGYVQLKGIKQNH